ncbi:hypothetical protein F2Q69_00048586 [Brassica cretica]|uniref:Uncharacterized protein n=1 Tax=Brassica cretica TaxID=69181 RepID=A0A8S9PLV1_BRACR|nr:hypothetical protein F2Q69_00048586 [Brassica cretica]
MELHSSVCRMIRQLLVALVLYPHRNLSMRANLNEDQVANQHSMPLPASYVPHAPYVPPPQHLQHPPQPHPPPPDASPAPDAAPAPA